MSKEKTIQYGGSTQGNVKKINKIDKPLEWLIRKKPMSEIFKGDISTDHTEVKYIRRYFEQIYAKNLEHLDERGKF